MEGKKDLYEKEEKFCITVKEGAKMCGLSINSFRTLLNDPNFPKVKVGRRILIPREMFINYIKQKALKE